MNVCSQLFGCQWMFRLWSDWTSFFNVIHRLILDVNGRTDYSQYERLFLTNSGCQWTFTLWPDLTSFLTVIHRLILDVNGRTDYSQYERLF
ncbi:hypothetical protein PO909_029359 [Leuciscus waleckii]